MQPSALRRRAGFTFIEILVVMGIIATLAGLGVLVVNIWMRRGPEKQTQATVLKVKALVDAFKARFANYPPIRLTAIGDATDVPPRTKLQNFSNPENEPIETLYQALYWPGFGSDAGISEGEIANTDDDKLPQALTDRGVELYEIVDAWGNPLVYFPNTAYAKGDQTPPVYRKKNGETFEPKPWRDAGGGFSNPNGFQIFSIGPDGIPNTEDDIKGW